MSDLLTVFSYLAVGAGFLEDSVEIDRKQGIHVNYLLLLLLFLYVYSTCYQLQYL